MPSTASGPACTTSRTGAAAPVGGYPLRCRRPAPAPLARCPARGCRSSRPAGYDEWSSAPGCTGPAWTRTRVHDHRGHLPLHGPLEADAARGRLGRHALQRIRDQVLQRRGLHVQLQDPCVHLGEIEEVVDELTQIVHLGQGGLQVAPHRLRGLRQTPSYMLSTMARTEASGVRRS